MDATVPPVVERLVAAINDHDADRVTECMASDYRSTAPVHPERSFTGKAQVRANWESAFRSTPDLRAEVERATVDDGTVWAEWRLHGTQTDGAELDMRGVAIWGIEDDLIQWGRIYLDPVEPAGVASWAEVFATDGQAGTG